MEAIKITWDEVKALIPEKTDLFYINYQDSLDNQLSEIQECIHTQMWDPLITSLEDFLMHGDSESCDHYRNQLQSDIEHKFELENATDIIDEFSDEILEAISERDKSTPINDLIRNTGKIIMFYDTGYDMESESWRWSNKRVAKERQRIKKHLGIKSGDTSIDQALWDCIQNATYGGRLEIYFRDNVSDFIEIDKTFNAIRFKNFTIGIIDHGNGSGYQTDTRNCTITLSLNPKNIFIEKNVSYNWTWDIAGMCQDAYDATTVEFVRSKHMKIVEESVINAHIEKEAQLDRVFKSGSCTPGDMKYKRHRNQVYLNSFPCGTKCMDCNTFWID